MIIVPWRTPQSLDAVELRLDVLVTLACGMATAIAVARLLSPILYRGLDRRLLGSDGQTSAARAWIGGLAVAGAVIGWQGVVPLVWVVVAAWCVGSLTCLFLFNRQTERLWVGNPTVWLWLGLLSFRGNWRSISELQLLPQSWSEITRHVVGAILLAPVCAVLVKLLDRPQPAERDATSRYATDEHSEDEADLAEGELG